MGHSLRFGDYEVDVSLFQLRRRGRVVPVERRVFDVIAYLLANSERVVSRDELVQHVWQGRAVSPGSLTVAIAAARRALGDDAADPQTIITHRGRGYRFCVEGETPAHDGTVVARGPDGFIGRTQQLGTLQQLLRAAASGRLSFATIVGEPGIGKSRLLERFASLTLADGDEVAFGRCREEDGAPPFWPWIQVAREICSKADGEEFAKQLAADAPVIARCLPGLELIAPSGESCLPAESARFNLFDGFARFLGSVAMRKTLVIFLDDIHRADRDSLLLLAFVLDALRSSKLMIVASYRHGELRTDPDRFSALNKSLRTGSGLVVELGGLGPPEIVQLVRDLAGWSPRPEQASLLTELTGGNPFFIGQLAQLLRREGFQPSSLARTLPPTVRDALLEQLRGISVRCARILNVASVIGREFSSGIVVHAVGLTSVDVARALEEAVEAGVISAVAGCSRVFKFKHALVREVLYQRLDAEERARLHLAVGEALLRIGSRSDIIAEVAVHFAEAAVLGDVSLAVATCCEAAELARKAVAYAEAVRCYQRALSVVEQHAPSDLRQKCVLLLALGSDQVRNGDRRAAKVAFERAAALADALKAPELLAEAALGVAPGLFAVEAGVFDELLVSLLQRSLRLLRADQVALRALVLSRLGMALFWSDQGQESARLSGEAWRIAAKAEDPALRLQILLGRWLAEWEPYATEHRERIAKEALALARVVQDRELLAMSLLYGLVVALERGALERFQQMGVEFRDLAEMLRQPQALWYAKLIDCTCDLHAGRFARAEERARVYHKLGRTIGDANATHSRMAQGLLYASERGDASGILSISEEGIERFPVFLGWRVSRCWGLARLGRVAEAEISLEELSKVGIGSVPRKLDWPTALVLLSETAFLLKRGPLAEELFGLMRPLAGSEIVLGFCVMSWGPVARYLGLLCEVMGRRLEARTWYEQAIDEARRSRGEPWEAHALFGLARVERLIADDRPLVPELATRAAEKARRLGMRHLAREISVDFGRDLIIT